MQDNKLGLTQHLVSNNAINLTVVDIGARGGFAPYWSVYGDCIKMVGFDADVNQAKKLGEKCSARILSADGKDRIFYIIRYPASSGLYPPNIEFTNRIINRDYLNILDTKEVRTVTLDSLGIKPDFIKADTEGSDLEILQGGIETMKSALGIRVEVEFQELFSGAPLFHETDAFMKEHGFTLFDMMLIKMERARPGRSGIGDGNSGQLVVGQALYFRDIYKDIDKYSEQSILKLASLFEVFNLSDCAYEILNNPRTSKYLEFIGDADGK